MAVPYIHRRVVGFVQRNRAARRKELQLSGMHAHTEPHNHAMEEDCAVPKRTCSHAGRKATILSSSGDGRGGFEPFRLT